MILFKFVWDFLNKPVAGSGRNDNTYKVLCNFSRDNSYPKIFSHLCGIGKNYES